jgi:glycosyltransferase involved in cell wall biosynthesis
LNIFTAKALASKMRTAGEGDGMLVTIVVPAHNAAGYVDAALKTAEAQTEQRIEIIVVDDASSDTTAAVVRAAAGQNDRIRLVSLPTNRGPGAARNAAIDAARGEWIALLDADDRYLPYRLARLLALAARTGAEMVSDNLLLCPDNGGPSRPLIPKDILRSPTMLSPAEFVRRNVATRSATCVSYGFLQPMIRRAFLDRHAIRYDERMRYGEDFVFETRCLLAGARWWVTPEPMYLYALRAGSLTQRASATDLATIRDVEQHWLEMPEVANNPELATAIRRHQLGLDRWRACKLFTAAVKARHSGEALRVLTASPTNFMAIVRDAAGFSAAALRRSHENPPQLPSTASAAH